MNWIQRLFFEPVDPEPSESETAIDPAALVTSLKDAQELIRTLSAKLAETVSEREAAELEMAQAVAEAYSLKKKLGAIEFEQRQWEALNSEIRWLRTQLRLEGQAK